VAFFAKTDPMQRDIDAAQRDLKAVLAKRDNMTALLKAAEAKAAECGAIVNQLAADAVDDIKLQPAIDHHLAADKMVAVRIRSLADVDKEVAACEVTVAKITDDKLRGETAAAEIALVDRWNVVAVAVDTVIADLVYLSRDTAPIVLDANGLQAFAQDCRAQIPPAIAVIVTGLKAHAAAVLAGTAKASLMRPDVPAPKPRAVPVPPTETVFFLRASKWTDENGKLHLIQKFTDATLPPALARHAIKVGAAVERTDPCRKQTLGSWSGRQFHAEHCFALDAASEIGNVSPIKPMFEKHPGVPEPYSFIAPTRPGVPVAATRTEKPRS
jgi:hypothetical protein